MKNLSNWVSGPRQVGVIKKVHASLPLQSTNKDYFHDFIVRGESLFEKCTLSVKLRFWGRG